MAGFSLGGSHRQGGEEEEEEGIPPENLFLYSGSGRTEEIAYTRGFELWQQQIHRHHHHHHHHHQQQQQQQQQHLYPSSTTAALLSFSDEPPPQPPQLGGGGGGRMRGSGSGSGSGGGMSCQDCGNQAKKDCVHLRCRTCCKSRGFQCPTHVKSTWVPAAKRRERQHQLAAAAAFQQQQQQSRSLRIAEPSKRPREICPRLPTAAMATSTSSGGGGMDAMSFPAEVSSAVVFRCVRVSPLDEAEDEFAYQTAVNIGGHVFKGILYDQGLDAPFPQTTTPRGHLHYGESSSSSAAAVAVTTAAAIATTLGGASTAPASAGLLDPSSLYPTPLSAFMAGTQFFPHHPRP